jgi:gluconate/galactonate dehydratase
MPEKRPNYEETLGHVNTYSKPSELRITDMRITNIRAPMPCPLIKIYTNQGLVGYGEVRDGGSKRYALMLKSRILGQNPCDIDKIFRRIKQFGHHARQAGGVCGIELALWDIAGKAYGVPIYQMLGGKFRDKIRIYCDTDVRGKDTGEAMGQALKKRMEMGFTFLKMDLGIGQLRGEPNTISAPLGLMERYGNMWQMPEGLSPDERRARQIRLYDINNVAHPFTGIHVTERGLDMLEEYVAQVRSVIGYEVPLAVDHFGHIAVEDGIKLAQRVEKFNLAWLEDLVPWQYTDQYVRLSQASNTPICTGEDIYLKENFRPLVEARGVSVIHPDILSSGGIMENKKIGDMAQDHGVAMAVHMAESPIACMAAVHSVAATENFMALENHSVDIPWWSDLVNGLPKPIIQNGFIDVPDKPGLGIESLNEELIAEKVDPRSPGVWEPTDEWDDDVAHDRLWS